jgi:hypothetical protein
MSLRGCAFSFNLHVILRLFPHFLLPSTILAIFAIPRNRSSSFISIFIFIPFPIPSSHTHTHLSLIIIFSLSLPSSPLSSHIVQLLPIFKNIKKTRRNENRIEFFSFLLFIHTPYTHRESFIGTAKAVVFIVLPHRNN